MRRSRFPDLIVLAQEPWGSIARRNALIINSLAQLSPRSRFLFVETPARPRAAASAWARRLREVEANVWAFTPVRPFPDRIAKGLSDRVEGAQVRRRARRLGLHDPWVWTQDPRAADIIPFVDRSGLIYDLTDDWPAFEAIPARRAEVRGKVDGLLRSADVVLACSELLRADASRLVPVHLLSNATSPISADGAVDSEVAAIRSPRLGYLGTLHDSRLDVDLIEAVANARPDWSFVFVGPNLLPPPSFSRISRNQNVHVLSPRAHGDVGSVLRAFDLGLVPNLVNDFTKSLDPLKTYQYLAAGLPVVSVDAGVPANLRHLVLTYNDQGEFQDVVERALRERDRDQEALRRAAVSTETWEARARELAGLLNVDDEVSDQQATLSSIVISYNTRDMTLQCLGRLRGQGVDQQILVIDNGSRDGSPSAIREHFPEVELIESETNLGFGAANNLALTRCKGEFVLFLNSDAFLAPGALEALISGLSRHPEAALVGPRLLNPDGTTQRSAWPFPSAWRYWIEAIGAHRILRRTPLLEDLGTWDHDEERAVDFLVGACMVGRRSAIDEVGGFDTDYFFYAEEADLQLRLARRGWRTVLIPGASVVHLGSQSSDDDQRRLRLFYAGQRRFFLKQRSALAWQSAKCAMLAGAVLRLNRNRLKVLARLPETGL